MSVQPLSYDTPRRALPNRVLHTIALSCGIIPLAIGSIIFVLFLPTRRPGFALLGFCTTLVGVGLAVVGFTCAGIYLFQARRAAPEESARAQRDAHRAIALIIGDFLVAFVMLVVGSKLMPTFD